jgi:ABC-2 type transport system ATP-binding protein
VRVVAIEGSALRLSAPVAAMDAVVKAAARHRLVDLVSAPADLEEIFLELYREDSDRD